MLATPQIIQTAAQTAAVSAAPPPVRDPAPRKLPTNPPNSVSVEKAVLGFIGDRHLRLTPYRLVGLVPTNRYGAVIVDQNAARIEG
jgi:hypothetical protein